MLKVKGFFFRFDEKQTGFFVRHINPCLHYFETKGMMLLVNKEVLFGSTAPYFVKFQMLQIKISGTINTNSVRDAQREKRRSVVRPRRHVLGSSL